MSKERMNAGRNDDEKIIDALASGDAGALEDAGGGFVEDREFLNTKLSELLDVAKANIEEYPKDKGIRDVADVYQECIFLGYSTIGDVIDAIRNNEVSADLITNIVRAGNEKLVVSPLIFKAAIMWMNSNKTK